MLSQEVLRSGRTKESKELQNALDEDVTRSRELGDFWIWIILLLEASEGDRKEKNISKKCDHAAAEMMKNHEDRKKYPEDENAKNLMHLEALYIYYDYSEVIHGDASNH